MIAKREAAFFVIIIIFGVVVSASAFSLHATNPLALTMRLLALNGYISLSIAVIMTPFLKEITLFFKKSFTKVHHYFAAAGLAFITLHPIAVAAQSMSLQVFLPNFNSPYLFFFYGGVIALILIYIGLLAVLIKKKIAAYWRLIHMLMYLALLVGIMHANLRGIDFQNIAFVIVFDALFVAALLTFALKRWQFYRIKAHIKKLHATKVPNGGLK